MEVEAHDDLKLLIKVAKSFKANHPILILVKNSKTPFKYIFCRWKFYISNINIQRVWKSRMFILGFKTENSCKEENAYF